jgi:hypothetical protein
MYLASVIYNVLRAKLWAITFGQVFTEVRNFAWQRNVHETHMLESMPETESFFIISIICSKLFWPMLSDYENREFKKQQVSLEFQNLFKES